MTNIVSKQKLNKIELNLKKYLTWTFMLQTNNKNNEKIGVSLA